MSGTPYQGPQAAGIPDMPSGGGAPAPAPAPAGGGGGFLSGVFGGGGGDGGGLGGMLGKMAYTPEARDHNLNQMNAGKPYHDPDTGTWTVPDRGQGWFTGMKEGLDRENWHAGPVQDRQVDYADQQAPTDPMHEQARMEEEKRKKDASYQELLASLMGASNPGELLGMGGGGGGGRRAAAPAAPAAPAGGNPYSAEYARLMAMLEEQNPMSGLV